MANEVGVLFDEFSEGGLLDDADVTIKTARFALWDYLGTTKPTLALQLVMTDAEGVDHTDHLSAGDLSKLVPSADGHKAVRAPENTSENPKLNKNTNATTFIISTIKADTRGELSQKLINSGDVSLLDGVKMHIIRKPQPKRATLQAPDMPTEKRFPSTVLTCEKLIAYPGENGKAAAPAASTVAAAAPAVAATGAAASSEVSDAAVSILVQIVAEAGGTFKKAGLAGKVFANEQHKTFPVPVKNAILGLIVKPDFLSSQAVVDAGVKFDPATGMLSMG